MTPRDSESQRLSSKPNSLSAGPLGEQSHWSPDRWELSGLAAIAEVSDLRLFEDKLRHLKSVGFTSVSSDIWWGQIEAIQGVFQWDYHKRLLAVIVSVGLKWVPIFSFHACGESTGDEGRVIPIPTWVWKLGDSSQVKFVDELGNESEEFISFWFEPATLLYERVFRSFLEAFQGYADHIEKVYLSPGASGELRYPSYGLDTYPGRGLLQCYSRGALDSFREFAKSQFGLLDNLNLVWNTDLDSWDQVSPPRDGDRFFVDGTCSTYGNCFLEWYQSSLLKACEGQVHAARRTFVDWPVRIGVKLPGIHWQIKNTGMPHSAEFCAGLFDYQKILQFVANNNLELTFTCLDLSDSDFGHTETNAPDQLKATIITHAESYGVRLFGENALEIWGESQVKFSRIRNWMQIGHLAGLTLLRLESLFDDDGRPNENFGAWQSVFSQPQHTMCDSVDSKQKNVEKR